jgi:beta-N-acetylhexosaminidase
MLPRVGALESELGLTPATSTNSSIPVPLAFDAPRYLTDIPTLFVSTDNPYHLQDVPRVRTFINAYTSNSYTVEAVVEKLLGHTPFTGINPIDPFCGYWDARL